MKSVVRRLREVLGLNPGPCAFWVMFYQLTYLLMGEAEQSIKRIKRASA